MSPRGITAVRCEVTCNARLSGTDISGSMLRRIARNIRVVIHDSGLIAGFSVSAVVATKLQA